MFQDVTPPREKKPYRSHFFTRRCSYVFHFFTRISSTTLKFTRQLYRKDGKQIQIRYRYSRFGVTHAERYISLFLWIQSIVCSYFCAAVVLNLNINRKIRISLRDTKQDYVSTVQKLSSCRGSGELVSVDRETVCFCFCCQHVRNSNVSVINIYKPEPVSVF